MVSSDNYVNMSKISTKLGEFLSISVCPKLLTQYSKLSQQFTNLKQELEKAGRFQKRNVKKQVDDQEAQLSEIKEKFLDCVFDIIVTDLKGELQNLASNLSTVDPQVVTSIRELQMPLTAELEVITTFIDKLADVQQNIVVGVREICENILLLNKSNISTYSDILSLDQNLYEKTKSLTTDSLSVMRLEELLKTRIQLLKEKEALTQRLASSQGSVQENLMQIVHELNSATTEAIKRDLITTTDTNVSEYISKIKMSKSIEELNTINIEIQKYSQEFSSSFKSELNRLRVTGSNLASNIRTLFPTLSDKWIPTPPEINIANIPINKIISTFDRETSWLKDITTGMKNIASTEEIKQVTTYCVQEGLIIPNTLLANLTESAERVKQVESGSEETFKELKRYHIYYMEFLATIKNHIKQNLNFDATDTSSGSVTSLKPPSVNFNSDNPTEILSYLRMTNQWRNKFVSVLQETRHTINETISNLNQLEKKGIIRNSSIIMELQELYNKIQTETDVPRLLLLRQSYDKLYKQIVSLSASYLKDFLNNVTIMEAVKISNLKPPFLEDVDELNLNELLDRINLFEVWKEDLLSKLRKNIESYSFPLIPGDVPVDLRQEKNYVLKQLASSAASRNLIQSIKSYFEFLNKVSSSKDVMLKESQKQMEILEKIDITAMKHFKEVIGSAPMFQIPDDLESLDFAELLEFWHRLNSFNKRKSELIQLKCREILSGWLKQYKSLPAQYLSLFNDVFIILERAITEINPSLGAEETINQFEFFIDNATSKTLESFEKLKANFYNKVIVSLPRISEVIGELSPEIHKVENFLIQTTSIKGQTLESIHRLTVETIHDYEYVLISKLMELLSVASRNLLMRISQLQKSGINIQSLVGEQIEVFSQIIQGDSSDMMSIQMITQSFVELDKITKNESLQKSLFAIIDNLNTTAHRIQDFTQAMGWKNVQHFIMPHVVAIQQAKNSIQFWSFDHIAKMTYEVLVTAKKLIGAIRELENAEWDLFLKETENDPKITYYNSIMAVFQFKLQECSEKIFPMKELHDSREKLQNSEDLEEVSSFLTTISSLKTQWRQEWVQQISEWHKTLFLFICDYKPTENQEERVNFLANAKKEIEETYSHKPMVFYLSTAVELYITTS